MSFTENITTNGLKLKILNALNSFNLQHKTEIRLVASEWMKELQL